ncbi:hypothetical protein [Nocardia sp. NPDC051750]|uniref:hypothetical protein n=1 Tax=Nocardia sp. NPDC051750 TaxID=3364325 RepID=UPI0037A36D30
MNRMTATQAKFTYDCPDSVWDAHQVRGMENKKGDYRGAGDFVVDDYRIFACTLREAKSAATWLARNGVAPKR